MHATIIDDLNGKNHATTDDIQNILNNFTYRILNPTLSLIMYTRVQYYLTSLHSLQVWIIYVTVGKKMSSAMGADC